MTMKLSKRLEKIASMIPAGRGLADIGTDHGYIPVSAALRGYEGRIIAADINRGPLEAAAQTCRENGVEGRIELILCDGLSKIDPAAVDTIVIAGMGGDTVTHILDRGYRCCEQGCTLILQPMTHAEILRYWLIHNDFKITAEALVNDGGTVYQILSAAAGKSPRYSDAELFTGRLEQISADPLFGAHLDSLLTKFSAAVKGMSASKNADAGLLRLYKNILAELSDMKRRL